MATVNSIIFSEDEAHMMRLILRHLDKPPDNNRGSWMFSGLTIPEEEVKPVGVFRILVIGANGVGKTSLLNRVS